MCFNTKSMKVNEIERKDVLSMRLKNINIRVKKGEGANEARFKED